MSKNRMEQKFEVRLVQSTGIANISGGAYWMMARLDLNKGCLWLDIIYLADGRCFVHFYMCIFASCVYRTLASNLEASQEF